MKFDTDHKTKKAQVTVPVILEEVTLTLGNPDPRVTHKVKQLLDEFVKNLDAEAQVKVTARRVHTRRMVGEAG